MRLTRSPVLLLFALPLACGGEETTPRDGGAGPSDTGNGSDVGPADANDAGADGGLDADGGPDLGPITPWEPPAQIDWAPCNEVGLEGLSCANLEVPLDHQAPRARIRLAMARAQAEDPGKRIGVLLVNPGGPGGRSREMVTRVQEANLTLRRRFDIIGVDWRGVGGSEPTLDCALDGELDELRTIHPFDEATEHQAWVDRLRTRCLENVGAEALRHVGVVDVARDMELVRRALGEAQLNFLGISYGTLLGATFATLYPTSIRAFALDAVVSPSLDPRTIMEKRTIAVRDGLEDFFVECARTQGCWSPGATATEIEASTMAFFSMADDGALASPDRVLTSADARAAVDYLVGPGLYLALGDLLRGALAGDPTLAFAVADAAFGRDGDGAYNGAAVANIAVSCRDRFGPGAVSGSAFESSLTSARQVDPRMGGWTFTDYRACVGWPAEAELLAISAPTAPKLLLVSGEKDWWTPVELTSDMRNALGNQSYLYESRGRGHARWDRSPASNRIRDYLLDPGRSPDETSCLRVPIERTITATLTFDVPIRSSAGGAASIEVRAEADGRLLTSANTPVIGAGLSVTTRLQVPSRGQPQALYLRITSTGHLTEEVHFNGPRRESTRVPISLTTQSNLESTMTTLGLTFDPALATAYIRTLDCEGPAGGIDVVTSTAAGRLVYAGLLDNRCVPDAALTNSDPICGSAFWYAAPPGQHRLSYDAGGVVLESRPFTVQTGVINHLVLDPAE